MTKLAIALLLTLAATPAFAGRCDPPEPPQPSGLLPSRSVPTPFAEPRRIVHPVVSLPSG